jgi:hypothetical protein
MEGPKHSSWTGTYALICGDDADFAIAETMLTLLTQNRKEIAATRNNSKLPLEDFGFFRFYRRLGGNGHHARPGFRSNFASHREERSAAIPLLRTCY